ncbi:MAG: type II toxin-antitoxin system death-on-curing family toxin [Brevibacterium aurantiacum]|uniref:Type II toxin-antitoxin system death-on-curing family toxin n=2 Tax=Brevibacterium aurantiacum TaxID=273384 RepID=A0A2A3YW16_BREAU|nr:type II toxin-antitoxin system death-on-curing family toxin [Brevibacterium aurantiacum]AZL08074.1 type II toxin-antitoxin system death-on-curing family toxin [Brevibacterium aurantiacum]AZL11687.1 type II toxin-antitoxin system death-on-curing family toxin [Brevibacterium aurantiacum]AZT95924.1 type II toxin-antitoxin system death-on-curing family toxin [Brevibacterium aurantiacum]PCC43962.1 type II toxin-antitoxin system death-on-curing family toxin [Brevibacterium aurantiacum]PCC52523.1 
MTVYLRTEDLLELVADLNVGPVRDLGLLDSAAHRPTTTLWATEVYPSVDEKGAVLLESIVQSRPMVDGNKRLGWLSLAVFYDLNGFEFDAPDDDAFDLVISVASGDIEAADIAAKLRTWRA